MSALTEAEELLRTTPAGLKSGQPWYPEKEVPEETPEREIREEEIFQHRFERALSWAARDSYSDLTREEAAKHLISAILGSGGQLHCPWHRTGRYGRLK